MLRSTNYDNLTYFVTKSIPSKILSKLILDRMCWTKNCVSNKLVLEKTDLVYTSITPKIHQENSLRERADQISIVTKVQEKQREVEPF
jgi:hypothetical protein